MDTRAFYSFAALKAFAFPLTLHFNAGMISAPGFPVSALLLESRRDTSLTLALRRFNCLCAVCLSLFGFQGSSPARPVSGHYIGHCKNTIRIPILSKQVLFMGILILFWAKIGYFHNFFAVFATGIRIFF